MRETHQKLLEEENELRAHVDKRKQILECFKLSLAMQGSNTSKILFINDEQSSQKAYKRQVQFDPTQMKEKHNRFHESKHSRGHSIISSNNNSRMNAEKENGSPNEQEIDLKLLNKTLEGVLTTLEIPISDKLSTIDLLKIVESEFEYLLAENRIIGAKSHKFFTQKRREYLTIQMKEPIQLQLLKRTDYQKERMKRSAIRARQISSRKIVRNPLERVFDKKTSQARIKSKKDSAVFSDKRYFEE